MKEKSFKNLKNKIGLKNFLVSKNEPNFRPKNINIKTINIKKISAILTKIKIFSAKNI